MATQLFNTSNSISAPYKFAAAVTPNDSADLTYTTRAVYIGGAGNMVATMDGGGDVTFTGLTVGSVLPVCVSRIKATSTTATNIVALW